MKRKLSHSASWSCCVTESVVNIERPEPEINQCSWKREHHLWIHCGKKHSAGTLSLKQKVDELRHWITGLQETARRWCCKPCFHWRSALSAMQPQCLVGAAMHGAVSWGLQVIGLTVRWSRSLLTRRPKTTRFVDSALFRSKLSEHPTCMDLICRTLDLEQSLRQTKPYRNLYQNSFLESYFTGNHQLWQWPPLSAASISKGLTPRTSAEITVIWSHTCNGRTNQLGSLDGSKWIWSNPLSLESWPRGPRTQILYLIVWTFEALLYKYTYSLSLLTAVESVEVASLDGLILTRTPAKTHQSWT